MLAARYRGAGEPFSIDEVKTPSPDPHEVLVDIQKATLCGTDLHYHLGNADPDDMPLTMGHEGAGIVAETGSSVDSVVEGESVAIHYVLSCGDCEPCLKGYDNRCRNRQSIGTHVDGTFAEYIALPARNVFKISDIPFGWASIAGCAVSTGYHAVRRSGLNQSDIAIIFGVGGVGLHTVLWADFLGAKVIAVDPVKSKLNGARKYGADVMLDPTNDDVLDAIESETDGWGVDVAIECSGTSQAMDQAIKAIKGNNNYASGTAVSVGVQHDPLKATYWGLREGQVMVSGDHTRAELKKIIKLLERGEVDLSHSITHEVNLHDVNEGLHMLKGESERIGRIAIDTENL